ncbi:hypothetical protein ACH4SP_42325 [Streptomyces sp. NPDC021093]|uniref:hypothetical protein n=1 Tax=Streptomyces sp. NPDC021093 TaxID=3365112 RepID=UPI0037AA1995
MPRLLVLGTGSLATAVCCALAHAPGGDLQVTVAGRSARAAAELAHVAGVRAHSAAVPVTFDAAPAGQQLQDPQQLVAQAAPDLVLVCASSHSPWERERTPSAWTDLVTAAGFGLTLPFQADLAVRAVRAVAATGSSAQVVNACFPDAVNPVLDALGLRVLCGVGNAGLVAASLAHALEVDDTARLRVLAHHVHLAPPGTGEDEARVWLDDTEVADPARYLARMRQTPRERLNLVTGQTAARVITALLHGMDLDTSVPGPWGLPGGYPVRVREGRLELALPAGLSRSAATAWNRRAGARDGIEVIDGMVRFTDRVRNALRLAGADEWVDGFPVQDLDSARTRLTALRTRLRSLPAGEPTVPVASGLGRGRA